MPSQWERFKQSNIAKIVIGYSLVVWVLIQLIEAVLPTFETPLWVAQTLTFLLILGFPIALLVGWAYEKLPARSADADGVESVPQPAHSTPKRTLVLVGIGSCAVIGLFGFYMMPFIFDQSVFLDDRNGVSQPVLESSMRQQPISNYRSNRASVLLGATGLRGNHNTRTDIAISGDGKTLAFIKNSASFQEIMIKDLTSTDAARVMGRLDNTGGSGLIFFSQDGEWLHFIDGGQLSRVRVEGGAFQKINNEILVARSGFTSFGGTIIFTNANDGQLYSLPVSGGQPEPVTVDSGGDKTRYTWPRVLPSNEYLLITASLNSASVGIGNIELLNLDTGEHEVLIRTASNATYLESGHIIFVRDSSIWAVPFDLENLSITGAEVPVIQGLETNSQYGHAAYAVSQDGRLYYLPGEDKSGSGTNQIVWADRDGDSELVLEDRAFGHVGLSPDEEQLAITVYSEGGGSDIWLYDFDRKTFGRRTFEGVSFKSVWSPDGASLIYASGNSGMRAVASNGTEQPVTIFSSDASTVPSDIGPDGTLIFDMGAPLKIYTLDLNGDPEEETVATELPIALNPPIFHGSQISPDGNWLAYVSVETGDPQIYVRPFPEINGGKWQASTISSTQPKWHPTSNELFFESRDGMHYSVGYEVEESTGGGKPASIEFGTPLRLFSRMSMKRGTTIPTGAYSGLAERFLLIEASGAGVSSLDEILQAQTNLVVVDNWYPEVQSLAPATVQ